MRAFPPCWVAFLAAALIKDSAVGDGSDLTCSTSACGQFNSPDQRQLIQRTVFQPAVVKSSEDPVFHRRASKLLSESEDFKTTGREADELSAYEEDLQGLDIPERGESAGLSGMIPQIGLSDDVLQSLAYNSGSEADRESLLPVRLPEMETRDLEDVRNTGRRAEVQDFSDLNPVGHASRMSLLQGIPDQDVLGSALKSDVSRGYGDPPEVPDADGKAELKAMKKQMRQIHTDLRQIHADLAQYEPERAFVRKANGQLVSAKSVNLAYEMQHRDNALQGLAGDGKCGGDKKIKCSGPNKVITFGYSTTITEGIFLWIAVGFLMCCLAPVIRCVFDTAAMFIFILQSLCVLAFLALVLTIYLAAKDD